MHIEVHRTRSAAECAERALVLRAVGIAVETIFDGTDHVLYVPAERAIEARAQLVAFSRENRPRPRRPAPVLHESAWTGPATYAVVLIAIAWLASVDAGARSWFDAGRMDAGRVQHGELWRIVTALTLHLDVGHLLANLGFGALFSYFCARLLGTGAAFGAILTAGALGNLINAWLQSADHRAVGASTAVFAALGLLAAYSFRLHLTPGQSWAYRFGPLIAGVALLGFTGTGGERTDVTAHATGFVAGIALGVLASVLPRTVFDRPLVQTAGAACAGAGVVAAWLCAFALTNG